MIAISTVDPKTLLYNDSSQADVVIKLNNGQIYAHKAVLASASKTFKQQIMENSAISVLYFPDYSDRIVITLIKFIYAVNYNIRPYLKTVGVFGTLTTYEWMDLLRFAHYAQVDNMTEHLGNRPPQNIHVSDLIKLGCTISHKALICRCIDSFRRQYQNAKSIDTLNILNTITALSVHDFEQFFTTWNASIINGTDLIVLCAVTHHHCYLSTEDPDTKQRRFMRLLTATNFTYLSHELSQLLSVLPLVMSPLLVKLIMELGNHIKTTALPAMIVNEILRCY
jgi:hypothetical protein